MSSLNEAYQSARLYEGPKFLNRAEVNHAPGSYVTLWGFCMGEFQHGGQNSWSTQVVASYPGPFRRKEPGTHCARMRWHLHGDRLRYHGDRSWVLHDVQFYGR